VCYSGRSRASKGYEHQLVKFSTFNSEWAVYDKLLLKSNGLQWIERERERAAFRESSLRSGPGATGLQEPNGKRIDLPYDENGMENILLSRYASFVAL
jgi:hypothetical protein